ncbi:MAG: hypothetical protein M3280_03145 [Actinomycetota bacterium]|nr:hypothetical protein [Actinomycetota bacterium]
MGLDPALALETVLAEGDEWQSWRALRLSGEQPAEIPAIPSQDESGGFIGPSGRVSPGATGEALCHLAILGLIESEPAAAAAKWLQASRTPAEAWLDAPDDVPGELDSYSGGRVWATAAASCGLLAVGRDPGARAVDLLRGEADLEGRFTGGAYPTFAAAGVYWLAAGPKTEMAEWALRWSREWQEEWWGPWEWATALTFWGAAGIVPEHPSVEVFVTALRSLAPSEGWRDDLGLTVRALELINHYEG